MNSVLILGAKSDIAKVSAEEYARIGYDLILAGRNVQKDLQDFKQVLKKNYNCNIVLTDFDILDYNMHTSFFESLEKKPTGIVSFIGYLSQEHDSKQDFKEIQKVINTNYIGQISIFNHFADYYENIGEGFIVGLSSLAGDRGRQSNYTYGSSKAGFTAYLSGLRNKLSYKNIQVLTIKPGFVNTKMTKNIGMPSFLISSPDYVGKKIVKYQQKGKNIAYIPSYWRIIIFIIKIIPENIFKRMNL
tara:strand:+ start:22199 stop:22933 length:735 start_codon:yes stop_codon:yes gene_type:complete